LAMSVTASIIVPQERFKKDSTSILRARQVANRMLRWGFVMGALLGGVQLLCLPLLNVFSPLKEVQKAARLPSIIGAALQVCSTFLFNKSPFVYNRSTSSLHSYSMALYLWARAFNKEIRLLLN
jgi:Na+-driven multidrug efflux pump